MADEPTLGEVKRRVEAGFIDVKEDIKNLVEALDRRVSMERYQLEREALAKEIREVLERIRVIEEARRKEGEQRETDRRAASAQRAQDRRLILTGLIVPVLMVLLAAYLSAKGAGG